MTNYRVDAARTFPTQNHYTSHWANSRFSDGRPRRKRAFGYVRVSTDMQAQYGLSLEAQKDQIAAYARAYSYEVVGFYVDHDSAKNTHGRPEYLKVVAEIDKGKSAFIISTALDRFSRSQRDFLAFQDEYVKTDKVHLVLINQGIAHRLNEKGVIPAQSAIWTKASVYDRMTNEKLHVVKSELGNHVYDRERAYNIAYAMHTDGHTLGKIAERLNKEGWRPSKASIA